MLNEKDIIRFKTFRGEEKIGIVTDVRDYQGTTEYSVFEGTTLPHLRPDCSESPWYYTCRDENVLEVIKPAFKSKKKKSEDFE